MKFDLDQEQRDFAASIDAALGAADVPGAVRAWSQGDAERGRQVWNQLAELGVTALAVPEEFDGIGAHPVDLVLAIEALGRWCVPGPVVESIAVAPILLAGSPDAGSQLAALAAGELIATVALPPHTPRALDAQAADLVLLAENGTASIAQAGTRHASVDPSRGVFDVTATGDTWNADTARAYEMGALATAAQLIGAGQAMLNTAVDYAKQRTQFGRVIGGYQAIKHKLADVHIALELARPWCTGRHSRSRTAPRHRPRRQRRQGCRVRRRPAGRAFGAADPRRHRLHQRVRPVTVAAAGAGPASRVGDPTAHRRRVLEAI